jgi:site-specific DNA recombinase
MGEEMQLGAINEYAAFKRWRLAPHLADLSVSGDVPLAKRKAGAELLARVKAGTKRIIVYRLDRLGRSVADISQYIDLFLKTGVELVSVSEGFDMSTPMGKMQALFVLLMAEWERMLGSQRMKSLHKSLREMNRLQGRSPPYGWDVGEGKVLAPNDAEQAVIRRMRNLRTRGRTDRQIAKTLNEEGIPSKNAGRWFAGSVKRVLERAPLDKKRDASPAGHRGPVIVEGAGLGGAQDLGDDPGQAAEVSSSTDRRDSSETDGEEKNVKKHDAGDR